MGSNRSLLGFGPAAKNIIVDDRWIQIDSMKTSAKLVLTAPLDIVSRVAP